MSSWPRIYHSSNLTPLADAYELDEIIAPNPYPTIEEPVTAIGICTSKTNQQTYVMKILNKSKFTERSTERAKRECEINMAIHHAHIAKVYHVYESELDIVLIMEYLQGGDLWDKVRQSASTLVPEHDAHEYMKQIMSAVVHLHDLGIAHRDLKPENILFTTKDEANPVLKLIDFGFSKRSDDSLQTPLGTIDYIAPEIFTSEQYDKSVDIWSVGCILYFMLFGQPPFVAGTDQEVKKKAILAVLNFPTNVDVSDSGKELISAMLNPDPTHRLTARQVMEHPWFKRHPTADSLTSSSGSNQISSAGSTPNETTTSRLDSLRLSMNMAIDIERAAADDYETKKPTISPRQPPPGKFVPASSSPVWKAKAKK